MPSKQETKEGSEIGKSMDIVGKILETIKLSPKYLSPIAISSGVILFFPDSFLGTIGLLKFREDFKGWIGALFLLLSSLLITHITMYIIKRVKWRLKHKARVKRINNLTPDEKRVLQEYTGNNTRTAYFDVNDGVVRGLEHEGIIYRSSDVSKRFTLFSYNVQPWAWEYLNNNPEVVLIED